MEGHVAPSHEAHGKQTSRRQTREALVTFQTQNRPMKKVTKQFK